MWDFLIAGENLPFTVALTIMLGLALLEGVATLIGAGISGFIDHLLPHIDVDVDMPDLDSSGAVSHLLGWLYVGKVPFLVLLIVMLTCFGIVGLIMQSIAQSMLGRLLPALLASPLAFVLALPVTRITARGVAAIMPRDETEAVSSESFIGRVAVITTGTARKGSAAQARLNDHYGQTHYVMVEPESDDTALASGSEVLLIKKMGTRFVVIANPNPVLVDNK